MLESAEAPLDGVAATVCLSVERRRPRVAAGRLALRRDDRLDPPGPPAYAAPYPLSYAMATGRWRHPTRTPMDGQDHADRDHLRAREEVHLGTEPATATAQRVVGRLAARGGAPGVFLRHMPLPARRWRRGRVRTQSTSPAASTRASMARARRSRTPSPRQRPEWWKALCPQPNGSRGKAGHARDTAGEDEYGHIEHRPPVRHGPAGAGHRPRDVRLDQPPLQSVSVVSPPVWA